MHNKNPYEVLGVLPNAKPVEIRRAYLLRTKLLHPDRFDQLSQRAEWDLANEMLKQLNGAYDVLGDASARAEYDRCVSGAESIPAPPPERQSPASRRAHPDVTHPHPARWVDVVGASLGRTWDRALDRTLSRCEKCKSWWSAGHEISRTELGREPAWTTVTRSQTTYRQDRDPAHTYITEWQETIPVIRIYYRVTHQCPKCNYTTSMDIEQSYQV